MHSTKDKGALVSFRKIFTHGRSSSQDNENGSASSSDLNANNETTNNRPTDNADVDAPIATSAPNTSVLSGPDEVGETRARSRSLLGSNREGTQRSGASLLQRTKSMEARALREKMRQEEEERVKKEEEEMRKQMEERRKKFDEETKKLSEEHAKETHGRRQRAATLQVSSAAVPNLPDLNTLAPPPEGREGFSLAVRWRYDVTTTQWHAKRTFVKLGDVMAKPGRFRTPHWLEDVLLESDGTLKRMVGKVFKEEFEKDGGTRKMCFQEARIDMKSKHWADEFNKKDTPEKVIYPDVFVYDLLDERGQVTKTLCGEEFFKGECVKYVDNKGEIMVPGNNVVEAFIHFSYETSAHAEMVLDIQIIGDYYTDPLIATTTGNTGDGDFGPIGMRAFMDAHKCNGVCYSVLPSNCLTQKRRPLANGVIPRSLAESFFAGERPPILTYVPSITLSKSFTLATFPASAVLCSGVSIVQTIEDDVKVVSIGTGTVLQEIKIPSKATTLLVLSDLVFIGTMRGSIHIFDPQRMRIVKVLSDFTEPVHSMCSDLKSLFAVSKSGVIKKWDIEANFSLAPKFISREVSGAYLTYCEGVGLFLSSPSVIYWYSTEGELRFKFKHETLSVKHVCATNRKLIVGVPGFRSAGPAIMLWDLVTRELVNKVELESAVVAIHPCAKEKCIVSLENGSVQICENMHGSPMVSAFLGKTENNKVYFITCGDHLKIWTVKELL